MVAGIAGGIMMAGLLAGALTGSVEILLGFSIVGLLIGISCQLIKAEAEYKKASHKLSQYPSYKY